MQMIVNDVQKMYDQTILTDAKIQYKMEKVTMEICPFNK